MSIRDEIYEMETVTRLACGALFGAVAGAVLGFKLRVDSVVLSGVLAIVGAAACSVLALLCGDRFWHAIFHVKD